jgi:hypothetical protein
MTIGCGVSHKNTKQKCTVQLKLSYKKYDIQREKYTYYMKA